MIRFSKKLVSSLKGNKQDADYVRDILDQRRFLKSHKFWLFIAASNILPLAYVYFAKTKAGEQMIFEKSRVKAWLRRYLAETEWSQFIQAYVDDYVLGENKAVLNLESGLDTKVKDGNLLKKTSVSQRLINHQLDKIEVDKTKEVILSPVNGKVLSFSQISDDNFEIQDGLNLSLRYFLTGDPTEKYAPSEIEEFKMVQQNDKSDIFSLVLLKKDNLSINFHSPIDFEVKNVLHYIGTFGKLHNIYGITKDNANTAKIYDKVEVIHDLMARQKVGYYGSSPYGMFTLLASFEDLPFKNEESVYKLLEQEDFSYNDQRILLRKLNKSSHIFQNQGNILGNFGCGNGLLYLIFELPKNSFKKNFEIGEDVFTGQNLFFKI